LGVRLEAPRAELAVGDERLAQHAHRSLRVAAARAHRGQSPERLGAGRAVASLLGVVARLRVRPLGAVELADGHAQIADDALDVSEATKIPELVGLVRGAPQD